MIPITAAVLGAKRCQHADTRRSTISRILGEFSARLRSLPDEKTHSRAHGSRQASTSPARKIQLYVPGVAGAFVYKDFVKEK